MRIETERLIIREFGIEDAEKLIDMASDGSLNDIFGDCSSCGEWMGGWIDEARALTEADDPEGEYLAYAVEEKATGRTIEKAGFVLRDKRMYGDLNDAEEKLYRFYSVTRNKFESGAWIAQAATM